MLSPLAKIDFSDYTELVPAFLTIVLMVFTFNIGVGMTAGLLAHPLLKTLSGRLKEVPAACGYSPPCRFSSTCSIPTGNRSFFPKAGAARFPRRGNDAGTSSSHEGKSGKIDQEVKGIIIS
jgi:hypothetical protein